MTLPGDPLSPLHLRLGNIVLKPDGQLIRIEYLSAHFYQNERNVLVNTEIINRGFENLSGLPIDEKWLSRLGFERVKDHWRIKSNEIILYQKSETSYGLENISTLEIRYVHHLQNLMFVIRGFEDQIFL